MAKDIGDLEDRARDAITREEEFVDALAKAQGLSLSQVKSASWFRVAVMTELAATTREWRHLITEVGRL
jgi:hypothetical protein